jgi:hypothetical protein
LRAKMGGRNGIFKAQECSQSVSSPTLETWWQSVTVTRSDGTGWFRRLDVYWLLYWLLYWFIYYLYTIYIDLIAKVCWGRKFHEAYCDIVLRRAAETRWFWCRFWMILVFLVDLNGVLMALVFCIF